MNNPPLLELYRHHGRTLAFLGVIVCRTEWTTQHEKDLMADGRARDGLRHQRRRLGGGRARCLITDSIRRAQNSLDNPHRRS